MRFVKLQTKISTRKCLLKIDSERGDVPRSRYIMRLLEKMLQTGPTSGERTGQFTGTKRSIQQGSDSAEDEIFSKKLLLKCFTGSERRTAQKNAA
jgi:hypothetical protein